MARRRPPRTRWSSAWARAPRRRSRSRDPFLADCRKSVGKKYAVEENRCFLEAKHARDWAKCAFKIDVLFHVKDADKDLQKREGLSCLQFLENNEGKK